MQWQDNAGTTNYEQRYGKYDRMSNLLRTDSSPTSSGGQLNFDQAYTYDGLNRLKTYKRGNLNNTQDIASPNFTQSWTLDALGNWAGFGQANSSTTINGTALTSFTQTRGANAANEIGTVTGTSGTGGTFAGATYDDAGNQKAGPRGDTPTAQIGYVYDGWNRLVGVDANVDGDLYDAGDVKYAYDGTGRRITKFIDSTNDSTNNAGSTEEYYQNEANQVLEVRTGTVTGGAKTVSANPKERYLWDLTYVDAPAMIELDVDVNGTRDNRLWATWDISHNVSSLLTDGGKVVEHYVYTPYGQRTILNGASNYAGTGADADGAEWAVDTLGGTADNRSDFGMLLGFQGLRLDTESGDWVADKRQTNPVEQWTQRDPIGYADGFNSYASFRNNPVRFVDPSGRASAVAGLQASSEALALSAGMSAADAAEFANAFARGLSRAGFNSGFLICLVNAAHIEGRSLKVGKIADFLIGEVKAGRLTGAQAAGLMDKADQFIHDSGNIATTDMGVVLDPAFAAQVNDAESSKAGSDNATASGTQDTSTTQPAKGDDAATTSPAIDPNELAGKTPAEIDAIAKEKGLIPKGPDPMNGKGAYVDPVTGEQRVLSHPDDGHAHVNDPSGNRLDINGNPVDPNSPAAHLPIGK